MRYKQGDRVRIREMQITGTICGFTFIGTGCVGTVWMVRLDDPGMYQDALRSFNGGEYLFDTTAIIESELVGVE